MITIKNLHRRAAAHYNHYYSDQVDDYYSKDGTAASWQGEGAKKLGLTGAIESERLLAMMRGDYGAGIQTTSSIRKDAEARAALDLTFSAPKSVSLQAIIGRDHRVIEAHDKAVTEALEFIEKELAQSRIKIQGRSHVEKSGNITVAKFRHETARPANDAPPDPQLHTHALIMNLMQRSDGKWVSLNNDQIVKNQRLIDAVYMNALARELEKSGFDIRQEKEHIELAHISRSQIEVFSKRLKQVDDYLSDKGLDRSTASKAQKQTANLATRQKKTHEIDRNELFAYWQNEAKKSDIHFDPEVHRQKTNQKQTEQNKNHQKEKTHNADPNIKNNEKEIDEIEKSPINQKNKITKDETTNQKTIKKENIDKRTEKNDKQNGYDDDQKTIRNPIARYAILWSIKHNFERESIVSEKKLLSSALAHVAGKITVQELSNELRNWISSEQLIHGNQIYEEAEKKIKSARTREGWIHHIAQAEGLSPELAEKKFSDLIKKGMLQPTLPYYTTPRARTTEIAILEIEKRGRDSLDPVMDQAEAQEKLATRNLHPGQRAAAEMILTTKNSVVGVQGMAGTGKSHMLQHTKEILESKGYKMIAVASYGAQVRDLRRQGLDATTIASRIEATQKKRLLNQLDEKTIVVIDEAGVVPARLMKRFLKILEGTGAKAVLLGDTEQTKAIEAGRPFEQMQIAGMTTSHMNDIVRQKNQDLKHAVELAASRRSGSSVEFVQEVHNIYDNDERYAAIAKHFVELSEEEREVTLIVSGTNESRTEINKSAHAQMGLEGKGHQYFLLTRFDSTQAERRYAKYYSENLIIQPERDYKCGLKRGEQYVITKTDLEKNTLTVQSINDKSVIEFSPMRVRKISVYKPERCELSVGDWVRVTRNDAALDLTNGERYKVVQVSRSKVVISANGREVELPSNQPLHLDYAYATTVHSAQGLTCNRVIMNCETFSRTTKQDVYYVGISRAKHEAIIYTESIAKLKGAVDRIEDKTAALDIAPTPEYKTVKNKNEYELQ